VIIEGKVVQLEVSDTNGQEVFNSIGPAYYRGADCVFLIYDVTKEIPLQNVEHWLKETNERLSDFERYNIAPN
jgi:GTPase SAR1 family protein